MLAALLRGIADLERPEDVEVVTVVVDNDCERSAEAVATAARPDHPWELRYVTERHRNISKARNTAVRTAGDVDFVAFVDDDEVPDPRWLTELIRVQGSTRAPIVVGPVEPIFDEPPPGWVRRGRFFEAPRFSDLQPVHYAYTSNVLITSAVLGEFDPPFDERFGLSGGEDNHFFLRARLSGHGIVWADRAVVRETVSSTRTTVRWLVRREYRRGATLSQCLRELRDSPGRRLRRGVHGALRIGQGTGWIVLTAVGGRAALVRGLRWTAFGLGLMVGLTGRNIHEYAVTDGR